MSELENKIQELKRKERKLKRGLVWLMIYLFSAFGMAGLAFGTPEHAFNTCAADLVFLFFAIQLQVKELDKAMRE